MRNCHLSRDFQELFKQEESTKIRQDKRLDTLILPYGVVTSGRLFIVDLVPPGIEIFLRDLFNIMVFLGMVSSLFQNLVNGTAVRPKVTVHTYIPACQNFHKSRLPSFQKKTARAAFPAILFFKTSALKRETIYCLPNFIIIRQINVRNAAAITRSRDYHSLCK
jgi:hypothetical protein